jgi:cardiolipin synthase
LKLLAQPGSGVAPIVDGIKRARSTVQIMIFRFDRREIERALVAAVKRGVSVHALIANTNRGGERHLRALETRLLECGVIVARTAGDLIRYHGKMMIIDKRELYVLGFNLALMDIEHSRSFGVITTNTKFVREAVKLFESDMKRQPYEPGLSAFVVSPENARKELSAFLAGAKRELLIYDPKIDDSQIIQLLEQRAAAGVQIRILGKVTSRSPKLSVHALDRMRLHTRTIIRDGRWIFIGSQSLRTAELDSRREVGIIFSDPKNASRLTEIFEADWAPMAEEDHFAANGAAALKVAKKVAKAVTKSLRPVAPVLEEIVKDAAGEDAPHLDIEELEIAVKEKVMETVSEVIQGAVEEEHDEGERSAI